MLHIYHEDPRFIFYETNERVREACHDRGMSVQQSIVRAVGGGIKRIFEAHEVWAYNTDDHCFTPYKTRSGAGEHISNFLEDKGVHIYRVHDDKYVFATPKDEFVFNLKFQ